jgi:putative MATE family efflux protein
MTESQLAAPSPPAPIAVPSVPSPPPSKSRYDRSIIDGPIGRAVWKLAWPTMLQNMIGGLQGMVDHALVGHMVGYTGNAAIGVSIQIWIVVIVFIASLFSGMGVLVARFVGADQPEMVNRAVYQAFITAAGLSVGVLAPLGYFLAPTLLGLINAAPAVQAEALPFLRIMLVGAFGMMVFFMLGGALRAAGDARTPLVLGIGLTATNILLNVVFIAGLGPVPALGTTGAAVGTVTATFLMSVYSVWRLFGDRWVVSFRRVGSYKPDWSIIKALFRFGLPTGLQGIAMNVAGIMLLRFIGSLAQSAEAQAAYAIGYTELFSLITWSSVGLMGATAAVAGQNLGAGRPERAVLAVRVASSIGLTVAAVVGILFVSIPRVLLGAFGVDEPAVLSVGVQLLRYLSVSGLFVTVALVHTGGLQGTGDTRSPLHISIISQIVLPLGICAVLQATRGLTPGGVWTAILVGHVTRSLLSIIRFRQGKWRDIRVEVDGVRA